jgi:hypothetical protein
MVRRADESYVLRQLLWPKVGIGPMLRIMKMPTPRRRWAGWAAAVLVTATVTGARADDTPPTPVSKPAPTRTTTTKHVVSTEAGGTVPSAPAPVSTASVPPAGSPTELPPLPSTPSTSQGGESTAANASESSEPPAPSEYDYAADTDPAALSDFRDALSPYGTWEEDPTYGVVWLPSSTVVGADFAPYVTHGHWGLGAGNTWLWVSDFSWGWAPFHYGRWTWIGHRGWGWIPGRVYAPAWVVWRTGFYDDYYVGWAPMPPSWYWRRGWAHRLGFYPPAAYVFCPSAHVFAPHVRMHIAPPARVNLIAPRTRPYVAANPSVSSAPTPYTMTRGPSLVEANVPASAVPAQRATPEPRAVSYARMQQPSRSVVTTQPGAFARSDVTPRPLGTPGSGVQSTGPLPPIGANVPRSQDFGPRPLYPTPAPMYNQPVTPMVPRASQDFGPRPLYPTPAPMYNQPVTPMMPRAMPMVPRPTPVMPDVPRPAPVVPMPHSYAPPSSPSFSRPAPPQMMRPYSPSPAMRPSAPPAVNMPRPSMVAPPSVRSAPVGPRIGR